MSLVQGPIKMKEAVIIFLSICGLFFVLSLFSSLNATTSTGITPPGGASSTSLSPRLNRCYGPILADSDYKQATNINCDDNKNNAGCQFISSTWEPLAGYIYGLTYNCPGGDAWTDCSPHCKIICGSPKIPSSDCDWK